MSSASMLGTECCDPQVLLFDTQIFWQRVILTLIWKLYGEHWTEQGLLPGTAWQDTPLFMCPVWQALSMSVQLPTLFFCNLFWTKDTEFDRDRFNSSEDTFNSSEDTFNSSEDPQALSKGSTSIPPYRSDHQHYLSRKKMLRRLALIHKKYSIPYLTFIFTLPWPWNWAKVIKTGRNKESSMELITMQSFKDLTYNASEKMPILKGFAESRNASTISLV